VYPGKCGPFTSILPENFEAEEVKDSVDFLMGRVVYLIEIVYFFMLLLFKSLGIQILSNLTGHLPDSCRSVRRSEEHHDLFMIYNDNYQTFQPSG
jgi:hypothetical protein